MDPGSLPTLALQGLTDIEEMFIPPSTSLSALQLFTEHLVSELPVFTKHLEFTFTRIEVCFLL